MRHQARMISPRATPRSAEEDCARRFWVVDFDGMSTDSERKWPELGETARPATERTGKSETSNIQDCAPAVPTLKKSVTQNKKARQKIQYPAYLLCFPAENLEDGIGDKSECKAVGNAERQRDSE